jgi:dUTP pyrophosphatase
VNAPGLIDSGYRGELKILLLNTDRRETFVYAAGDRIAQLLLISIETSAPVEVADLTDSERGAGGFGSSG